VRGGGEDLSKNFILVNAQRDAILPFIVIEIGIPPMEVGTYALDESTACGDILELGEKGVYKVKRVRVIYR
jgi:hypothetical protein